MFAMQEMLRGYYTFTISHLVVGAERLLVKKLSIALVPIASIAGLIGIELFGGIGVPLGIALSYIILIYVATKKRWSYD